MNDSAPDFVDFTYEVELDDKRSRKKVPLVVGVIANLSGNSNREKLNIEHRKFVEFDRDNFDARLKSFAREVPVRLPDTIVKPDQSITMDFGGLSDFDPQELVKRVDSTISVAEARRIVAECRDKLIAHVGPHADAPSASPDEPADRSALRGQWLKLLARLRPCLTAVQQESVEVREYWGSKLDVLDELIGDDIFDETAPLTERLAQVIQRMDAWLARQIEFVIHQPDFQQLESTWRGLEYLVTSLNLSDLLTVRVFDASKTELMADAGRTAELLRKKLLTESYYMPGEAPYTLLIVDFEFGADASDVRLLSTLAEIAHSGHTLLITAPQPELFDVEAFLDLAGKSRLAQVFRTPALHEWRALARSPAAQSIVMSLPRMLGRDIHLNSGSAPDSFRFLETISAPCDRVWIGSAYALAEKISRTFEDQDWWWADRRLEDHIVTGVPTTECVTNRSRIIFCCPTDAPIDDENVTVLSSLGFTCLQHQSETDIAVFRGPTTLFAPPPGRHKPGISNIMNAWQIGRVARCLIRDHGLLGNSSAERIVSFIESWLYQYVSGNNQANDPRHPLADIKVTETLDARGDACITIRVRETGIGAPEVEFSFPISRSEGMF